MLFNFSVDHFLNKKIIEWLIEWKKPYWQIYIYNFIHFSTCTFLFTIPSKAERDRTIQMKWNFRIFFTIKGLFDPYRWRIYNGSLNKEYIVTVSTKESGVIYTYVKLIERYIIHSRNAIIHTMWYFCFNYVIRKWQERQTMQHIWVYAKLD